MRLGLHVNNSLTTGSEARNMLEDWIREVRPPMVKFLADAYRPDVVDFARQHGCKVIARRVQHMGTLGPQGRDVLYSNIDWAAERGFSMDYLEFANEEFQGLHDPTEWDRLSQYMLGCMQSLDQRSGGRVKAIIYNCSVGQPEPERWMRPDCIKALRYAEQHGHLVGLHEYYKPTPWTWLHPGHSWHDWGNAEGYLMLRCRTAVRIWDALGLHPGFVITESGRDDVPGTPGHGKGFRDDPTYFVQGMTDYCRHLSFIKQCKGVVDFGFNATGDHAWDSFRLDLERDIFYNLLSSMKTLPRMGDDDAIIIDDDCKLYEVKRGDTLWRIASEQLGDGRRWPELLRVVPMGDVRQLPVGALIVIRDA